MSAQLPPRVGRIVEEAVRSGEFGSPKAVLTQATDTFSCHFSRRVRESIMKAGLLLLAISSLLAGNDKTPAGEIVNPQALVKVQSYCVDLRDLSDFDRHLVTDFLKAEGKPKHLLSKLLWKLAPDCENGAPDAVAKVEFVRLRLIRAVDGPVTPGQNLERPYEMQAALHVVDASSQESLYNVQAGAVMNAEGAGDAASNFPTSDNTNPVIEQREALYHAFWSLVDDVRQLRRTQ